MTQKETIGQNVIVEVSADGKTMTLTIDLTKDFGPSSSGKTQIVASSKGNADVPGKPGYKFGLNVYRK